MNEMNDCMTSRTWCEMLQEYVRKMGLLLVKLQGPSDPLASTLNIYASECVKFMGVRREPHSAHGCLSGAD